LTGKFSYPDLEDDDLGEKRRDAVKDAWMGFKEVGFELALSEAGNNLHQRRSNLLLQLDTGYMDLIALLVSTLPMWKRAGGWMRLRELKGPP
jgi:hypothetical protein